MRRAGTLFFIGRSRVRVGARSTLTSGVIDQNEQPVRIASL